MKFSRPSARVFIPDGLGEAEGLTRVTRLGIGAHQDDLEFMAFEGIVACRSSANEWFCGVTCTNGAGSSRTGKYASYTDADMMRVRQQEQDNAAAVGRYAAMIQLDHPSSVVKSTAETALKGDLGQILRATHPSVVYTHNPADKHDTHIGVMVAVIEAIRALPPAERPARVIGCEVWRSLDWLQDADKIIMNVSGEDHLAAALNGIFDSQIAGGKRYDLATLGRRSANATFFESHATDKSSQVIFGIDLTPLVSDEKTDIVEFTTRHMLRFVDDVQQRLKRRLGTL